MYRRLADPRAVLDYDALLPAIQDGSTLIPNPHPVLGCQPVVRHPEPNGQVSRVLAEPVSPTRRSEMAAASFWDAFWVAAVGCVGPVPAIAAKGTRSVAGDVLEWGDWFPEAEVAE
ncbi:MAG: hypothetical protein ACLPVY_11310 [Acidimicrobiia bacterium]